MAETTLAEVAALVRRTKMSLSEGGRPDLAEHCAAVVDESGRIRLTFAEQRTMGKHSPEVLKALSLDPLFEFDAQAEAHPESGEADA